MDNGLHTPDNQTLLQQNRLLTEEIQRRVSQLAAINTVAATVSQVLDLDLALQTALDAVLGIIGVEAAGISLVDEQSGELVLRAQRGWTLDFVSKPMRIKLGEGLSGEVVAHNKVIVTGDLTDDQRLAVPAFSQERVQAMAMAPMHARGRVIGVLSVMSHTPYHFSDEEIDVLKAIADQVGVALDNARLYEETRSQQERLSAVIHSAADAIIATDDRGCISLLNDAAKPFFEESSDQIIGMPLHHAPLHPILRDGLKRAMQNQDQTSSFFDVTLDDGRTLAAVVSHLRRASQVDQADIQDGWVVVLQDVSHLKAAERSRISFIQTAAHDLRNPLGVTLSALVMLREAIDPSDASMQEVIEIAIASVNRIHDLIDDLLNLEHIESGVGFQTETVDLSPLLADTLTEMSPTMQRKNQSYNLNIPAELPPVTADVRWLRRAVVNYLSNASKYTQPGGHITLHAYAQDDGLHIEVQDNGQGIPLEAQGRLFERFYRVPGAKEEIKGTGLGLAIVKSIAEAHGGRVEVESAPGRGSCFRLRLRAVCG
jgi:PAS domain S-box-containing protein